MALVSLGQFQKFIPKHVINGSNYLLEVAGIIAAGGGVETAATWCSFTLVLPNTLK